MPTVSETEDNLGNRGVNGVTVLKMRFKLVV
jgi:hypothetical protein